MLAEHQSPGEYDDGGEDCHVHAEEPAEVPAHLIDGDAVDGQERHLSTSAGRRPRSPSRITPSPPTSRNAAARSIIGDVVMMDSGRRV
jgi:hypothetical protein